MTTEQVRERATAILSGRLRGARAKAVIVKLRDGTTFTGVLMEHVGPLGPREELGFALGDGEIRRFDIHAITDL